MALHNKLGIEGEQFARAYLEGLGCRILHANWRHLHKEIDLVALHNQTLLIVEVKTRTHGGWENPRDAITSSKIKFLTDAAEAYIMQYNRMEEVRFDVLTLIGQKPPFEAEYIPGAFVPQA